MSETLVANLPGLLAAGTRIAFPRGFAAGLGGVPVTAWVEEQDAPARSFNVVGYDPVKAYSSTNTPEGEDIATEVLGEGPATTFTMVRYTNGFSLTPEGYDFLPGEIVQRWLYSMGLRAAECIQKAMIDLLRLGFTNGLFANNHSSNVGNLSNIGSTALGHASYAAARAVLARQKSNDGDPAACFPAFLFVPPELEALARQIVTSPVTDSNLQTNVFQNEVQVVVSPFLTDTTDWMLTGSKLDNPFKLFQKRRSSPSMFIDPKSRNLIAVDDQSFVGGVADWRGTFGSQVAGS